MNAAVGQPDSGRTSGIHRLLPSGHIAAGYNYGLIPYVVGDSATVSSYFQTEGNIDVSIRKIPLDVSYFYTSLRGITGLNNYFRVSFDAERYKNQFKTKITDKRALLDKRLDSLQRLRQQGMQKQLYGKYLLDEGWKGYITQRLSQKIPSATKPSLPLIPSFSDTLHAQGVPDSLRVPDTLPLPVVPDSLPFMDTLSFFNLPDSTELISKTADSLGVRDSLVKAYDFITQKLHQIESQITRVRNERQKYESAYYQKIDSLKNSVPKSVFLNSIRKFEIGLCYPDLSPLLASGTVLKGFQTELMAGRLYIAAAAGKTYNNLLFATDLVSNRLQNVQNLFNYFDFSNVNAGRNILVLKAGPGEKTSTHLHVGFLMGRGLASYMLDSNQILYSSEKELNKVFEVDGRVKINKYHALGLIYAKSLTQLVSEGNETGGDAGPQWFSKSYFSHAVVGRYEGSFPKIKSGIIVQTRWIDAYFKSYGVAFARPDNLRYEIRTDHQLRKNLKVGFMFRTEENNIRHMYAYSLHLYSAGAFVSYRPVKTLQIKLQYRPVFMRGESSSGILSQNNRIATGVITYSPVIGKNRALFTAIYNYFHLSDGYYGNVYESFSFSGNSTIYKQVRAALSTSYYGSKNTQSIGINTHDTVAISIINRVEIFYFGRKNFSLSAGAKAGWSEIYNWQYAWSASVQVPIGIKGLLLESRAEKMLYGDFFNAFDFETFKKFPYTCQVRLLYNW